MTFEIEDVADERDLVPFQLALEAIDAGEEVEIRINSVPRFPGSVRLDARARAPRQPKAGSDALRFSR